MVEPWWRIIIAAVHCVFFFWVFFLCLIFWGLGVGFVLIGMDGREGGERENGSGKSRSRERRIEIEIENVDQGRRERERGHCERTTQATKREREREASKRQIGRAHV